MKLHIIRHGYTAATEKHLYCGKTDLPLSESGTREIRNLKIHGIYPGAEAFITSGMQRAEMTLDLIYGSVPRTALSGFAEYDFGDFEMRSYEELKEIPEYIDWMLDETGEISCPGGESRLGNSERVMDTFSTLLKNLEKSKPDAALICHGGTISVIMDNLFGGERNFYEWQPSPGRGYTITFEKDNSHTYQTI